MRPRLLVPLAVLAVVLGDSGGRSARAEPLLGGATEPVAMQADQLDVDVNAGSAVLTGNVSLAKGDLHVSCPRIEVKFDSTPHVSWARGSGGVAADVRGVHAEAPEVELDLDQAAARAARRRPADARAGLAAGGAGEHRHRHREGDAHAGQGGDPGDAARTLTA